MKKVKFDKGLAINPELAFGIDMADGSVDYSGLSLSEVRKTKKEESFQFVNFESFGGSAKRFFSNSILAEGLAGKEAPIKGRAIIKNRRIADFVEA